jgi:hypothetical protein
MMRKIGALKKGDHLKATLQINRGACRRFIFSVGGFESMKGLSGDHHPYFLRLTRWA